MIWPLRYYDRGNAVGEISLYYQSQPARSESRGSEVNTSGKAPKNRSSVPSGMAAR